MRYRTRDGKQQYKSLGDSLDFDEARREAENWLAQLVASAVRSVKRSTVRQALEGYLADLRRHGRPQTAAAEGRFKTVVYGDLLSRLPLESLTREDLLEWRDRLVSARLHRRDRGPVRQARTVNRHVRSVVAALNRALELGHIGNPAAWKIRSLPDDVDDSGETAVFLDASQRKALIAAASAETALFLRGLELTGARPKELAEATVGDFSGTMLRLAHRKGRPPKLRVRHTVLSSEGIEFFRRQMVDKLPAAPLFTEDGKQTWRRHIWSRKIRAAIAAHNLEARGKDRIPTKASAYSFRHARISELLQVYAVDPLTVAAQTGTSLAMIEKAYLRFIPSAMQEKLAAIKGS